MKNCDEAELVLQQVVLHFFAFLPAKATAKPVVPLSLEFVEANGLRHHPSPLRLWVVCGLVQSFCLSNRCEPNAGGFSFLQRAVLRKHLRLCEGVDATTTICPVFEDCGRNDLSCVRWSGC